MTVAKVTVSLPAPLAEAVRRLVEQGRAESVSAYVTAALRERVAREDLLAMFDELLEETGGPVSDAERTEIDRIFRA